MGKAQLGKRLRTQGKRKTRMRERGREREREQRVLARGQLGGPWVREGRLVRRERALRRRAARAEKGREGVARAGRRLGRLCGGTAGRAASYGRGTGSCAGSAAQRRVRACTGDARAGRRADGRGTANVRQRLRLAHLAAFTFTFAVHGAHSPLATLFTATTTATASTTSTAVSEALMSRISVLL